MGVSGNQQDMFENLKEPLYIGIERWNEWQDMRLEIFLETKFIEGKVNKTNLAEIWKMDLREIKDVESC